MKMSKRIFIALLIVSVIVSVFTFSVSAAEENNFDYGYLLEYYEEPVLFDYDFSKENVEYSIISSNSGITSEIVTDANAPGGKYLSITTPKSAGLWADVIVKNDVYLNWNATDKSVDDFILEMTVSGQRGDGDEKQLPKIIISLADETCDSADVSSTLGATIVALDFRSHCFAYLKSTVNTDGETEGVFTNTEFTVSEGVWYNVYVQYETESGAATVTVTNASDPTDTYTVADVFVPYDEIKNVRVGAHGTDGATSRDNVMNFASLRAIGGKYDRHPSELQTAIDQGVIDMYADFMTDEVSFSVREYLSDVAIKLHAYGFVPGEENLEAQAAFAGLLGGTAPYCNDKLVAYAESYNNISDYYERRDLIDEALVYVDYLGTIDASEIPADLKAEIEANIATINGFDTALKNAEIGSLALINAVGKNMSANYDDYNEVVAKYNQLHEYGQYADPTYKGAYEAYVFYSTIREAKEDIETNAKRFIDAANILNSEADFNTIAAAFLVCKNNYYANTTYPGLAAALDIYNSHYDTVNTQIEMAENFIKYVGQADYADYVPMKLENLAEAEKYMGCLTDDPYIGVTEAKALYDKVRAEVDENVRNAELYIAAVNALDSLSGDALLAGIENALSLKAAGDVLGVDGVADANIKLDKLVSSIELAPKHRDYFLSLVASIDSAATSAELFEILRLAQSAEADAVAALAADPSYQSAITEASAKLAIAIENFNAQVTAVNAEFVKANQAAANTCGIGKGTTPVADRVIALIKKFFEE